MESEAIMISELGYIVVGTRDVAAWRAFAERVVGAMVTDAPHGGLYVKIDQWQHRILIVPFEREQLLSSAWAVRNAAAFAAARAHFVEAGVAVDDLAADALALRGIVAAFAFDDPAGNHHEIFWGRTQDVDRFVSPVGVRRFVTGDLGLGHVVLPTGDRFDDTVAFWEKLMNVGLSDFSSRQIGTETRRVGFYHLPNARQHSIAFAEIDVAERLLHFMFEVEDIDEVGHAIDRCAKEGAVIARSLGRHVNDGVISIYIDTPSGFHIEYGCGGYEMDWASHEPYNAAKGSHWGHVWATKS